MSASIPPSPQGRSSVMTTLIFYGQRADKAGAVRDDGGETNRTAPGGTNEASFEIDLRKMPQSAEKLRRIAGTISDAQKKRVSAAETSLRIVGVRSYAAASQGAYLRGSRDCGMWKRAPCSRQTCTSVMAEWKFRCGRAGIQWRPNAAGREHGGENQTTIPRLRGPRRLRRRLFPRSHQSRPRLP